MNYSIGLDFAMNAEIFNTIETYVKRFFFHFNKYRDIYVLFLQNKERFSPK